MQNKDNNTKNSSVYIAKYDHHLRRLFFILHCLLLLSAGIFCVYINLVITILLGIFLILAVMVNIIDVLFFKVLIIDDDCLTKEWYLFGKRSIKLSNLRARATNKLYENSITFSDKNKNILQNFYMTFETFLTKDNGYERIREILIKNSVIKGDDMHWNKKKNVKQKFLETIKATDKKSKNVI